MSTLKPYVEAAHDAAAVTVRLAGDAGRPGSGAPLAALVEPVYVLSEVTERLANAMRVTWRIAAAADDGAESSEGILRTADKRVGSAAGMLSEGLGMLRTDLRKAGLAKEAWGRRLHPAGAWGQLDRLIGALDSARDPGDGTLASLALALEQENRMIRAVAGACRAIGDAAWEAYEPLRKQLGGGRPLAPGRVSQAGTQLRDGADYAGRAVRAMAAAKKTGAGAGR